MPKSESNTATAPTAAAKDGTLEAELRAAVRSTKLTHHRALLRRLGWDGHPATTLREAGETSSLLDAKLKHLTRERVRQLEQAALEKLGEDQPAMPVLAEVHRVCVDMPVLIDELVNEELHTRGLSRVPWELPALLKAFEAFGLQLPHVRINYRGQLLLARPELELKSALDVLGRTARDLCRYYGCASLAELRQKAPALKAWGDRFYRYAVDWNGILRWLDAERTWFWLPSRVHSAVRRAEKALLGAGTLTFDELYDAVAYCMLRESNVRSMGDRMPSREQIRWLLRGLDQFEFQGERVQLTARGRKQVTLTGAERIAFNMLRKGPGDVLGTEIVRAIMNAGGSKPLACGILARGPFVVRVGNNRYRLIGSNVVRQLTTAKQAAAVAEFGAD